MRTALIVAGLLFCVGCNQSDPVLTQPNNDDFYERCRKLVLSENNPKQEYFFSRKSEGVDEVVITYLGDAITTSQDTLKIVNSINYSSGCAKCSVHGNGKVFIYDSRNMRIGLYYVGGAYDVPSKVENDSLIFSYANDMCNQTTAISLKDSIPNEIFVLCKGKWGDVYDFTNEY